MFAFVCETQWWEGGGAMLRKVKVVKIHEFVTFEEQTGHAEYNSRGAAATCRNGPTMLGERD